MHVPPAPGNQTSVQTTHHLRLGASTQIGSYREWQKSKGVAVRSILRATLPRALPCGRALCAHFALSHFCCVRRSEMGTHIRLRASLVGHTSSRPSDHFAPSEPR